LPDYVSGSGVIKRTDLVRQLWLKNNFYGGVFSLQYNNEKWDYTAGGNWSRFKGYHYGNITWAAQGIGKNYQWYRYPALKDDGNIFAKAGYKINDRFYVMGDVQYRHVNHTISGTRKFPELQVSRTFNFFNPKLGVNYRLKDYNLYILTQ
jgi:iron complex outermembrane receptor protein